MEFKLLATFKVEVTSSIKLDCMIVSIVNQVDLEMDEKEEELVFNYLSFVVRMVVSYFNLH